MNVKVKKINTKRERGRVESSGRRPFFKKPPPNTFLKIGRNTQAATAHTFLSSIDGTLREVVAEMASNIVVE